MARTAQYQKLLNELESGELSEIERKILDALLQASKGLTRQGLIRIVFGGNRNEICPMIPTTEKYARASKACGTD